MKMTNDIAKLKQSRNIWRIIFAISLALNIAVLGALGVLRCDSVKAHLQAKTI